VTGPGHWPFGVARVRLLYGERGRRTCATWEAREQLLATLATFEPLGARPCVDRTLTEPRAAGRVEPSVSGPLPLTAEERRIATPTATGLANKQIAERPFLAHRTLGGHPYRLCRNLGIISRTAPHRTAPHCATPSHPGPGECLAPRRAGRPCGLRAP
jgi:DNA-binding CsgD family transcriptional regulator